MKIRVAYTVDLDDRYLRAFAFRYGLDRKPNRTELLEHFMMSGGSEDHDILAEYDEEQASHNES